IEALYLDLAADHPEGVTTGRKPLDQPTLDEQQARLVVLHDRLRHDGRAVALDHREVARADARLIGHIDALDIDRGRDLPEHPRLPWGQQVRRTAVEADDGDLVRLGLYRREQLGGEIRPRGVDDRVALGR